MYLDHFGLSTDPFPMHPSLRFVYMSTAFEEAMAHLAYGLEQNEDIILITGPIGTGKTLAIHSLLANVGKLYRAAFVNVTQVEFPELLKLILADLQVSTAGFADRADLLNALKAQVRQAQAAGQRLLVVVDEAQNLSPETLEGLRLLTNLGHPQGPVLQIILSGQTDLEHRIDLPQLAQLRQRIRVHYRLQTLDRAELDAYIAHRLKIAGCDRPLFKSKALDAIYKASLGVPRLVNVLASRALLAAYVAGRTSVEVDHVDVEDLAPAAGVQAEAAARLAAAAPPAAPPRPAQPAAEVKPPVPVAPIRPMAAFQAQRRRRALVALVSVLLLAGLCAAVVLFVLPRSGSDLSRPGASVSSLSRIERGQHEATGRSLAGETTPRAVPAAPDSGGTSEIGPNDGHESPPASAATPAQSTGLVAATDRAGEGATAGTVSVAEPGKARAFGEAESVAASAGAALTGQGLYAVHVHSFREHARTAEDLAQLQRAGYPSFYRTHLIEGVTWERVYVGPFRTLAEAQAANRELMREGRNSYTLIVKLGDGDN